MSRRRPRAADALGPPCVRPGTTPGQASPARAGRRARRGESDYGSVEAATAWVVEGTRQLERGGFLDRDQERNLLHFHQTLRDHAEQRDAITPKQSRGRVLRPAASSTRAISETTRGNYQAIDRCFDNALTVMEMAWAARREPGPLDAVLVGMVDSLGYYLRSPRPLAARRSLERAGDCLAARFRFPSG